MKPKFCPGMSHQEKDGVPSQEPHPCPFKFEVNDDESPCWCCKSCEKECEHEI